MKALSNQIAIVTGAARGIGSATARRLAADGAAVVVNFSASAHLAEQTVGSIQSTGGKAISVQADVSDASAISRLFDAAEKAFGPATILINNAGVYELSHLEKEDKSHFEKIFHSNVLGTLLATAEFARRFKSSSGRVINISSGLARHAMPGAAVYGASKAAIEGLTRTHAVELGRRGVTVNTVSPGITETEMLKKALPEEIKQRLIADTALGRLGQPEDIADVVAFLCSNDARWITGQFVDVNGGLRL